MTNPLIKTNLWIALLLVLTAAAIFLLDLAAPADAACGTLYITVVLLSLRFDDRRAILATASVCSMLILSAVVTVLLAPDSDENRSVAANLFITYRNPAQVLTNAFLELFATWVAAIFGYHLKGLQTDLVSARDELQERFEERSVALKVATENLDAEMHRSEEARQQLIHSEAHYLSLVENLPIHVIRKDAEGRFTFVSPSFAELLERRTEQILGKTDFDFYPRELAEKYRHDDLLVVRNRTVLNEVETNQTADGKKTFVQVIKVPVIDAKGRVIGIQGIFWDVTARMQAEDELRESEARKRAILESAMDSIVFLDKSGSVVDVNRAALDTLRCQRSELLDTDFSEVFEEPVFQRQFRKSLAEYIDQDEIGGMFGKRMEVRLKRPDESFLAELSAQPIPVQGFPGFAVFFHDITERKSAEAAILRARDEAQAANHAKSLFLTNMSHEIRTPMNAITGITDLLIDSEVDNEQREYLNLVQESAGSLLDIINDILDFSKIEANRLELCEDEFDLHERLSDTMRSLAIRAHGKGLEFVCEVDPDVPRYVVTDDTRLRQVLVNLVGNAIKFTKQGEVVVRVKLLKQERLSARIEFSVQDTGIGIPADRREAIFAAFEQADNSTTREYGGTGLGLAISSRLVRLLNGRMWVNSEVHRGSTFYFTVLVSLTESNNRDEADVTPAEELNGMPVLLVEDNMTQQEVLLKTLRHWHMLPAAAANAEEALRVLNQPPGGEVPGLVLIDSQLPGTNGLSLAARIRRDWPECRIVMLLISTHRTGHVAHCEELGVGAYLLKPVIPMELLQAIRLALSPPELSDDSESTSLIETSARRPLDILLAEDSLVNQKLALGLLSRAGHTVQIANNGREALAAVANQEFDLVLMDVQMPELDGLETTRNIRRREESKDQHLPIIAMTAHAVKGYREICLEAGMDGYLSKPIRSKELFEVIDDVLGEFGILDEFTDDDIRPEEEEDPVSSDEIPAANGVINWEQALEVVQGDRHLLREIILTFLDEVATMMASIDQAILDQDAEALHRYAHTVKGSMRIFGAQQAFDRALELEQLGRSAKFEESEAHLPMLRQELDLLVPLLRGFTETGRFAMPVVD